jgi:hypothetical protein
MTRFIAFTLCVSFIVVSVTVACADVLTGKSAMSVGATVVNDGVSNSVYVSPMRVDNHTTDQRDFLLFCGDFNISTSATFGTTGQEYGAFALASPSVSFYSDVQKDRINDLFGYTYATAFDLDGNILNTVYAQAIQLAIWSILHETTDDYNILEGSFRLANNYNSSVVSTTNALLDAVLGNITWGSIGLGDFFDYDLTVYVAEGGNHVSQTLISVTGTPNREPNPTPEPATMLMFGLGLAGLGLTHRLRKNAKK